MSKTYMQKYYSAVIQGGMVILPWRRVERGGRGGEEEEEEEEEEEGGGEGGKATIATIVAT